MVTVNELKVLLTGDNSSLKESLKDAEGSVSGFGGVAEKALGVAKGAAIAFGAASVALIGTGLKIASDLEQAQVRFETLLGSGEKAKAFLDDLKAFSLTTPFQFDELAGAAQKMISLGVATDQVIPLMRGVGDAAQALGGGAAQVDTITSALAKIQQTGKVTAKEVAAIAATGVPAWEFLAKTLGTDVQGAMEAVNASVETAGEHEATIGKLRTQITDLGHDLEVTRIKQSEFTAETKESTKAAAAFKAEEITNQIAQLTAQLDATLAQTPGKAIDAATFVSSFMEGTANKFGGAMEKQSQTLEGLISSTKDEIGLQLAGIAQPVLEALKPLIPIIGGVLGNLIRTLAPAMVQLTTLVGDALTRLLPLLMPIIEAIASLIPIVLDLAAVFVPILQEILAAVLPVVKLLLDGLKPILLVIVDIVKQQAATWETAFLPIIQAVLKLIVALLPLLNLVAVALQVLSPILLALNPLLELLSKILVPIIEFITLIVDALVSLALALTGNREAWERFAAALDAIGTIIVNGVKDLWNGLVDWFVDLGQRIIDGLVEGLRNAWEGAKGFIGDIGNGIKDSFTSVLGISSPSRVFKEYGANIVRGLEQGLDGMEDVMARAGVGGDFTVRLPNAPPAGFGNGFGAVTVQIGRIEIPVTQAGTDFDPASVGDAIGQQLRRAVQEAFD